MGKISAPQVRKVLHEIIATDPDRTNEGKCVYLKDDGKTPHCLAGAAFSKLLPSALDWIEQTSSNGTEVARLSYSITSRFSPPALALLTEVQSLVDAGGDGDVPWSEAASVL